MDSVLTENPKFVFFGSEKIRILVFSVLGKSEFRFFRFWENPNFIFFGCGKFHWEETKKILLNKFPFLGSRTITRSGVNANRTRFFFLFWPFLKKFQSGTLKTHLKWPKNRKKPLVLTRFFLRFFKNLLSIHCWSTELIPELQFGNSDYRLKPNPITSCEELRSQKGFIKPSTMYIVGFEFRALSRDSVDVVVSFSAILYKKWLSKTFGSLRCFILYMSKLIRNLGGNFGKVLTFLHFWCPS